MEQGVPCRIHGSILAAHVSMENRYLYVRNTTYAERNVLCAFPSADPIERPKARFKSSRWYRETPTEAAG